MANTVHFAFFRLPAIWTTVTLISYSGLVAGSCDSPWFENDGRCYYMSPNEDSGEIVLSWHDAEDWCRQNGAHLTTVDSKEELDAIVNTTSAGVYTGSMWIGLNRLNDPTTYEWVDGSDSGFRYWAPGQPRNGSVGMCAHQLTYRLETCHTMVEDENILKTILAKPEDAQPPDTFHFWSTMVWEDPGELARCQQSCTDEPDCYYYTFVSWSSTDYTWDGTCTGASSQHAYEVVVDQYAYSGIILASCEETGTWNEGNCGETRGFICERGTDDPSEPLPTPAPTPSVPGYCPSGFFDGGGNKCFKLVEGTPDEGVGFAWEEARQLCLAEKGNSPDLGTIHSEYENAAITMHLRAEYWGFWIGLQFDPPSNQWLWTDNQDPEYLNWAAGEPSGSGYCAELWTNPGPAGTWNNEDCTDRRGYLCQTYKDADDVIATPPTTVVHGCTNGYENYGGICYKKVTAASDWSSALVTCEAEGATLATVHSDAENSALYVFASDIAPFWIGYYRNGSEWIWTDDWPNIYSNWNASEGPGTGGGCASFKDTGKWKDDYCTRPLNFVCMLSTATVPTKPPELIGVCLEGWVEFGSFCYYFSQFDWRTWSAAEQQCISRASQFSQGSLVSIHSPAEDAFVYKTLQSKGIVDAWIGLRQVDPESPFTWSDGSVVQYVRWAPGEPNNGNGNNAEHCAEMYVDLWPGMWNDNDCTAFAFDYVCKAPKVDEITTTTPTPTVSPCPFFDDGGQPRWAAAPAAGQRAIPPTPTEYPGSDSASGIWLSSGELAGIVLGTMFGTLMLVAIGVFIWRVVRGGELSLSKSKKTGDTDAASTYDLPYKNFENSLSRSSSIRSAANPSEFDAYRDEI